MRTKNTFAMRACVAAVNAALAGFAFAPAALAADSDDAALELTRPRSVVEVGGLYVDEKSAKFGEYNGLDKKGGYFLGNFWLYGGDANDSAFRWRIFGTDVGLDTRNIQGEVGTQGRWRVNAGYEEIPHRVYDNFQTIWNGGGSSTLTLPSTYPAASTRASVTNNANGLLSNWNNIQAPNATASTTGGGPASVIAAALHPMDIGTDRKRSNVGLSYILSPGWEAKASVRHEDKDGTKLTGIAFGGQRGALLPEPISQTHDQFEASIGYTSKQAHFTVGYYGSIFKNDTTLWTAENPFANNALLANSARMSGAPDNQMHQLNLAGGYNFSQTTRLSVVAAYARLTQNQSFIAMPPGNTWNVPVSSADAKVINTSMLARFTARPAKYLDFVAAYRYDDRDNKTPTYNFLTAGADGTGAPSQYTNEPNHRRIQQLTAEGTYRLAATQAMVGGYEWTQVVRKGSTYEETPFPAEKTTENALRIEYRNTMTDQLTARFSYVYSQRRSSDYDDGNPRPVNPPAPLPGADPLLPGFRQFWLADRNRDKLRSTLVYQATEQLSLQGTLDYNRDTYNHSQYGLQKSDSWVATLDAGFAASEALSLNAFFTYEDMSSALSSLAISRGLSTTTLVPHTSGPPCSPYTNVSGQLPADYYTDPCRQWSYAQGDRVQTIGAGFRYRGLLSSRFDLSGDLSYSYARSSSDMAGGAYYNNGVPNSATGNGYIAATSPPSNSTEWITIRLNGIYAINKSSAVRMMYQYAKLKATDFQYDAFTNSALGPVALQAYIGNGLTAPNYNVNVVGVSYLYRFR